MTDPRTPDEGALPPAAEPTPVDPPTEDSPQLDSFAAEPPPAEPIPGEPAEPVPPVAPAEFAAPAEPTPAEPTPAEPAPAEPAPAEPAPAEPRPEDVPAERTLADEDPATPEPGSSDPVVLPPPPGTPEDTDADADADADAAPAPTGHRRAWLPLAAVGAVVALLVAGTGYAAWQLRQEAHAEQAREQATAAARDAARLLFSYDHETLDADFEKGLSVTTGRFREQYSRTTREVVTPVAEQYDAVVVAEVIEAAIVEASADRVTALVFLNQGTTSTRVQGQQVDQSRVRMSLVRQDGRWLVEGVNAL